MPALSNSSRPARLKKTRWLVRATDRFASALITVGGIGTIVSVSLVFVLVVWVVAPLFRGAVLGPPSVAGMSWTEGKPLAVVTDNYGLLGWVIYPDGRLEVFRVDNGAVLAKKQLTDAGRISATSVSESGDSVALGLENGSMCLCRIRFEAVFLDPNEVTSEMMNLPVGGVVASADGLVERTPERQFRLHRVADEVGPPIPVSASKLKLIDHLPIDKQTTFALLSEDGKLRVGSLRAGPLVAGIRAPRLTELPLPKRDGDGPWRILIPAQGNNVYVVWRDGQLIRFDISDRSQPVIAETVELLSGSPGGQRQSEHPPGRLGAVRFALGRETLLVGDSRGGLSGWFRVRNEAAQTSDGRWLLPVHILPAHDAAVTALGISPRSRMIAVGYADGTVRACHVTTEKLLVEARPFDHAVEWTSLVPKSPIAAHIPGEPIPGGLLAAGGGKLWKALLEPGHPEATFSTLFLPVWYESYERPEHVWQTSASDDAAEMKLGLWPLVFGTLKATLYSMLFGAPLALLAAIYTSEFLSRSIRSKVKPAVEMMAGLPSVVLGFLAALVIAPVAEKFVPVMLAAFLTIPFSLLLGAYLWQLVPRNWALVMARARLPLVSLTLVLGVAAAYWAGPVVERIYFAGNVMLWLDGQRGTGTGGWVLILLPFCAMIVAFVSARVVNPRLVRASRNARRGTFALFNLAKFLTAAAVTLVLAQALGQLFSLMGFDPRGSVVDTYVQRNALIVGFVMGFAIIPIIYTIADDALTSVPGHLRSASLGAGATPWQTTVRIVVPAAMSGLFSAIMVGLGRAVGETMIVLMAAGNVPIRDWNIFNGFQTLSAAIAVELPEAAKDTTHYRTLFLAALCLLMLTFVVNTLAELVRIRFRRRAIQL